MLKGSLKAMEVDVESFVSYLSGLRRHQVFEVLQSKLAASPVFFIDAAVALITTPYDRSINNAQASIKCGLSFARGCH